MLLCVRFLRYPNVNVPKPRVFAIYYGFIFTSHINFNLQNSPWYLRELLLYFKMYYLFVLYILYEEIWVLVVKFISGKKLIQSTRAQYYLPMKMANSEWRTIKLIFLQTHKSQSTIPSNQYLKIINLLSYTSYTLNSKFRVTGFWGLSAWDLRFLDLKGLRLSGLWFQGFDWMRLCFGNLSTCSNL